jgi:hypothetical protein
MCSLNLSVQQTIQSAILPIFFSALTQPDALSEFESFYKNIARKQKYQHYVKGNEFIERFVYAFELFMLVRVSNYSKDVVDYLAIADYVHVNKSELINKLQANKFFAAYGLENSL